VLPGGRAGRRLMELLSDRAPPDWTPLTFMTLAILAHGESKIESHWPRLFAKLQSKLDYAVDLSSAQMDRPKVEAWWPVDDKLHALHAELTAEVFSFRDLLQATGVEERPLWEVLATLQDRFAEIQKEVHCGDPHLMRLAAL
jgi:hypothetical protein